MKDRGRVEWHEVKKVDHYWLKIDAITETMKVHEPNPPYGDPGK